MLLKNTQRFERLFPNAPNINGSLAPVLVDVESAGINRSEPVEFRCGEVATSPPHDALHGRSMRVRCDVKGLTVAVVEDEVEVPESVSDSRRIDPFRDGPDSEGCERGSPIRLEFAHWPSDPVLSLDQAVARAAALDRSVPKNRLPCEAAKRIRAVRPVPHS
jgi:hypothetical protein